MRRGGFVNKSRSRRIIFLDIDGVLRPATRGFMEYCRQSGDEYFDPACVGVLNAIIRLTKAKIVVHSAWRDHLSTVKELRRWLHANGVIGHVIGRTPKWEDSGMIDEINEWWKNHKVDRCIIIDDSDFSLSTDVMITDHYLQTNPYTGLMRGDVLKAIRLLSTY